MLPEHHDRGTSTALRNSPSYEFSFRRSLSPWCVHFFANGPLQRWTEREGMWSTTECPGPSGPGLK